jgi:ribonuclease BN (tRNA processing enzyme)
MDPSRLDAIVVSHMHADHFFDIVPLRYALRYEMPRQERLPVFLPPKGMRTLRAAGTSLSTRAEFFDTVFELCEYTPKQPLTVKSCTIRFAPAVHYIPAYAMRIETVDAVLGYSADTAPCDSVPDLVSDADLFLCEASLGAGGKESNRRGHLNAAEAGELAKRARVKQLVLTHYSAAVDPNDLRAGAGRAFGGPIAVADDGMEFRF